jgi:hypothetical protein
VLPPGNPTLQRPRVGGPRVKLIVREERGA